MSPIIIIFWPLFYYRIAVVPGRLLWECARIDCAFYCHPCYISKLMVSLQLYTRNTNTHTHHIQHTTQGSNNNQDGTKHLLMLHIYSYSELSMFQSICGATRRICKILLCCASTKQCYNECYCEQYQAPMDEVGKTIFFFNLWKTYEKKTYSKQAREKESIINDMNRMQSATRIKLIACIPTHTKQTRNDTTQEKFIVQCSFMANLLHLLINTT